LELSPDALPQDPPHHLDLAEDHARGLWREGPAFALAPDQVHRVLGPLEDLREHLLCFRRAPDQVEESDLPRLVGLAIAARPGVSPPRGLDDGVHARSPRMASAFSAEAYDARTGERQRRGEAGRAMRLRRAAVERRRLAGG